MGTDSSVPNAVHRGKKPMLGAPVIVLRNMYGKRRLIRQMISRDLHLKYHKSLLGWAWSLIEPLALTATFWLLFEILSVGAEDYRPLKILIGIMIWGAFAKSWSQGTKSLESNTGMIQRVAIPREIFIHSIIGLNLTTMMLNLIAVIPLLIWYGLTPTWNLLYLPLAITMLVMLSMGLAMFTSILQARWRDFTHLVNLIIRIGFYLSPVFYTFEMMKGGRIPEHYIDTYLWINPMAVILTLAKCSFTGEALGISNLHLVGSFAQVLIICILGMIWFVRKERKAVKYL
jgi:ABC-type polysaccharide/polyol phosphate export permease